MNSSRQLPRNVDVVSTRGVRHRTQRNRRVRVLYQQVHLLVVWLVVWLVGEQGPEVLRGWVKYD